MSFKRNRIIAAVCIAASAAISIGLILWALGKWL